MNLPPPVLPPTDSELQREIETICEAIVREGEIGEDGYRDQVRLNSSTNVQEINKKAVIEFRISGKRVRLFLFSLGLSEKPCIKRAGNGNGMILSAN